MSNLSIITNMNPFSPNHEEIENIISSRYHDPFSILGPHLIDISGEKALVIRTFLPNAENVSVIKTSSNQICQMTKIHPEGLYQVLFREETTYFKYKFKAFINGMCSEYYDPYSFPLSHVTNYDIYLFNQGTHYRIFEKLGAHTIRINDIPGIHFAVWAPNAIRVSIVSDFNKWDGRVHQMKRLGRSGIWALFIPEIDDGAFYKFEIRAKNKDVFLKSDPYAFYSESPPKTSSIVYNINQSYNWRDSEWIAKRADKRPWKEPISIYEVHLGSWKRIPGEKNRFLTYNEFTEELVSYVKEMGFTHIELLPIMAHPYDPSWGYQVSGYYSPTARYGRPEDLMHFIDICHQNNIGVLLDWVPAHFPKDAYALAWFDGTCLYEHADPKKGEHKDWGTLIFNYGRLEVNNFLIANALFWLEKYHFDGFRVDAVASMLYLDYSRKPGEWIPNKHGGRENLEAIEFLKHLNNVVYEKFPGVLMIAEESTAWPAVSRPSHLGGLGFGFKWNMGWMHDVLNYMQKDPIHKRYHHHNLTFGLLYAFQENFILPLSHDEVVHGKRSLLDKMPGDYWQKMANLRLLYAFMYGHPGKKLLFMGGEFGQWKEWNHAQSLDWHLLYSDAHSRLQRYVKDLNAIYRSEPALFELDSECSGFEWIDANDSDNSVLVFMRKGKDAWKSENYLVVALNFTPIPRNHYRIGVPFPGFYKELINSDSDIYGGSNKTLPQKGAQADNIPWHMHPYSIHLSLPPLGAVVLKAPSDVALEKNRK
ncbi:MAG: 1,4-alpha-glucan branching protein GlgB [Pseudomonadota bacterium]